MTSLRGSRLHFRERRGKPNHKTLKHRSPHQANIRLVRDPDRGKDEAEGNGFAADGARMFFKFPAENLTADDAETVICADQEMHGSFDYAPQNSGSDEQHTGAPLTMTPCEGLEILMAHAGQQKSRPLTFARSFRKTLTP